MKILLVALLALVIAGGGVLAYESHKKMPTIGATETSQPEATTSVANSPSLSPVITGLTPSSGKANTTVTITGSGFDSASNDIYFGDSNGRTHPDGSADNRIVNAGSINKTSLMFAAPASGPGGILCDAGHHCVGIAAILRQPGKYKVQIKNKNGTSNVLDFLLTK